jgi:ATP-dependent exoDNAse (exonuclease V) beta subunit
VLKHEESSQQRANLLKLIDLCSEFESLQFESLNALGIYGRNLNSFLSWLSMNDNDAQPASKSINTEAVQLLTWHGSKGLEWPVVVVMGLDHSKGPSLPSISLGYTDESRNDPLVNSYVRFFTKFQDDSTNEAFIEALNKDAHSTAENLLYVAMTRAREQLILPWPSFKEKKPGEFSFMHKLMNKCNMKVNSDCISMDNLSRDDGFSESVVTASLPGENDVEVKDSAINYGRVAIEIMEDTEKVPAQVSPSSMEQVDSTFDKTKLSLKSYGAEVDLSGIKMEASDLGTLLHRCYHVLLVDKALSERLFVSIKEKLPQYVWDQIQNQVALFKDYSKNELQGVYIQCEVPILSKTEQGSVLSGSIDVLMETDRGYWIIDHKSDTVSDFEMKFTHHYPQLEAYATFTKLDKPLLGVGINWVRYGKMSLLPIEKF